MRLTFENATIQDVIGKAARVAPTRGSSFDKANGILITARDGIVSVRATDLEIFYHEVVDVVEVDEDGEWRLPSVVLAGFMNKIPASSGKTITFWDDSNRVIAKTGNLTAKFRMLPAQYFPEWEVFDSSELVTVEGFASRIQQVSWAADEKAEMISGVHLNGERVMATDRFRIAQAPCEIPDLMEPLTVPASIFDPIMKSLGDVRLGVDGGHLLLMPDEFTQIKAIIFGGKYPNIDALTNTWDFDYEVKFKKSELIDMIDMTQVFAGSNRYPKMSMAIGREAITVYLDDKDHMVGDTLPVDGQAVHARKTFDFTPRALLGAISASPSEEVIMSYRLPEPGKRPHPVQIDGGSGYRAWVMPRREVSEDS